MVLNQQHIYHGHVPLEQGIVRVGSLIFEGDLDAAVEEYNKSKLGIVLERQEEDDFAYFGRGRTLSFGIYRRKNGGVLVVTGDDPDDIDSTIESFLEKTLVTSLPFD
ncbi:MAG: hypothetical protein IH934_07640 [Nanoarchaeota archaeon]|nr:hypothetical protein [Nanoarchaeota archaeon]